MLEKRGGNMLFSSTSACRRGAYAPFFAREFDLLIPSWPIAIRGSIFAIDTYPSSASLSGLTLESFPSSANSRKLVQKADGQVCSCQQKLASPRSTRQQWKKSNHDVMCQEQWNRHSSIPQHKGEIHPHHSRSCLNC